MKTKPFVLSLIGAAALLCGPSALTLSAQPDDPPPVSTYQPLSDQQLDQLLGPIALYPDPLLAEILPAATQPAQIVLADRYLAGGGDPAQVAEQAWDPSVQALTHYPAVMKYLDDNLAWTTELGLAFANQQPEVMESIQRLRMSAQNFGNLVSTPQEQVVDDGGDIEILPTDDNVIYVPVYQPQYIYDQSGCSLAFSPACVAGPWLSYEFDWTHQGLRHWGRHHYRPANWWNQQPDQRDALLARQTTVWQPISRRIISTTRHADSGYVAPAAPQPQPQPQHNMIVKMSKPLNQPRPSATPAPAATPRPQVVRETRTFTLPDRPAPPVHAESSGAFVGGESTRDAHTFSERGQESVQAAHEPEPPHYAAPEPPRAEPPHVEPPHNDPPSPPPAHPAESGGGGSHDSQRR